jgi:hypothetical protein
MANHTSTSHSDVRDGFPMSGHTGLGQGQFQYMQVSTSKKPRLPLFLFVELTQEREVRFKLNPSLRYA